MKKFQLKYLSHAFLPMLMFSVLILVSTSSCNKFLEVGNPKDRIVKKAVFTNDQTATSAVVGIYSDMMQTFRFLSSGVTWNTGLCADELDYLSNVAVFVEFYQNLISVDNTDNSTFWD